MHAVELSVVAVSAAFQVGQEEVALVGVAKANQSYACMLALKSLIKQCLNRSLLLSRLLCVRVRDMTTSRYGYHRGMHQPRKLQASQKSAQLAALHATALTFIAHVASKHCVAASHATPRDTHPRHHHHLV